MSDKLSHRQCQKSFHTDNVRQAFIQTLSVKLAYTQCQTMLAGEAAFRCAAAQALAESLAQAAGHSTQGYPACSATEAGAGVCAARQDSCC